MRCAWNWQQSSSLTECHGVRHLSIRHARSVCAHARLCTHSWRRSHATPAVTWPYRLPETVGRRVRRGDRWVGWCRRVLRCSGARRRYSIGTTPTLQSILQSHRPLRHSDPSSQWRTIRQTDRQTTKFPCQYCVQCDVFRLYRRQKRSGVQLLTVSADITPARQAYTSH